MDARVAAAQTMLARQKRTRDDNARPAKYGETGASAKEIHLFNSRHGQSSASVPTTATNDTRELVQRTVGAFSEELKVLMYAHGDDKTPDLDAVALLEDITIEHIVDMCTHATRVTIGRTRPKLDDFKFLLRHDPRKLARVEEMIRMSAKLEALRKPNDLRELAKLSEHDQQSGQGADRAELTERQTTGDDSADIAGLALLNGGGLNALEGLDEQNILRALGVLVD